MEVRKRHGLWSCAQGRCWDTATDTGALAACARAWPLQHSTAMLTAHEACPPVNHARERRDRVVFAEQLTSLGPAFRHRAATVSTARSGSPAGAPLGACWVDGGGKGKQGEFSKLLAVAGLTAAGCLRAV